MSRETKRIFVFVATFGSLVGSVGLLGYPSLMSSGFGTMFLAIGLSILIESFNG